MTLLPQHAPKPLPYLPPPSPKPHSAFSRQHPRYYDAYEDEEEEYARMHYPLNAIMAHGRGFVEEEEEEEEEEWEEDDGDGGSDEQEVVESKKEKRRREYTEKYQKLNVDFMDQKEKIYKEKLSSFQADTQAIQDGTHPEFLERLSDLEQARDRLIEAAELLRDYRLRCADDVYGEETAAAEQEYHQEREGLREKMLAAIEERRKKLKEDKDAIDLTNMDVAIESQALGKRNLRNRGMKEVTEAKSSKRRREEGPRMVFLLKDEDAIQDLATMRKGMPTSKKTATKSKK